MTNKIEKGFLNKDAELVRSPVADAVAFQVAFGDKVLTLELSELSKDILHMAALHGLSQKIGDAASGYAKSGIDPMSAMGAVIEQLKSGNWNKPSTGGNGAAQSNLLAEALSRAMDKPIADCINAIDGLDDEQKKALRKRPIVAAKIAEIQSERKAAQTEALEKAAKDDKLDDILADLF